MAKVEDCPGFETFGADVKAARKAKQMCIRDRVEHDQARLYVMELETAVNAYETDRSPALKLEILSQAMDYVHLLRRHIEKENGAIYPFAERALSPDTMRKLEAQFQAEWNHA